MNEARFVKKSDVLTAFVLNNIDEAGELVRSLAPEAIVELQANSIKVIFKGERWLINPGDVLMISPNGVIRYVCRSHEEFKKEYCNITDIVMKTGPRTDAVTEPYVGDLPRTMMDPKALLSLLELAYKELHPLKQISVTSDLNLAFPKSHCIIIV